jgi:hypothetical protein
MHAKLPTSVNVNKDRVISTLPLATCSKDSTCTDWKFRTLKVFVKSVSVMDMFVVTEVIYVM